MKIEEPHLQTLLKHKHIHDLYIASGEIVGLSPEIRKEIFEAYKVENPHAFYNDRCHICIVEMLVQVYRWFNEETKN